MPRQGDGRAALVVLADDQVLFRESLATALPAHGIRVVGQCGDGGAAVAMVRERRPDVLLLDYEMPGLDATAVIEHVRAAMPRVRVLVLSVHEQAHLAVKMIEAGAHGYAIKSCCVEEIVGAIRALVAGEGYVAPPLASRVIRQMGGRAASAASTADTLSPREYQLLRHIAAGRARGECAHAMGVGPTTVAGYRRRLMKKLGARSTADLVRFAIEKGLLG